MRAASTHGIQDVFCAGDIDFSEPLISIACRNCIGELASGEVVNNVALS